MIHSMKQAGTLPSTAGGPLLLAHKYCAVCLRSFVYLTMCWQSMDTAAMACTYMVLRLHATLLTSNKCAEAITACAGQCSAYCQVDQDAYSVWGVCEHTEGEL